MHTDPTPAPPNRRFYRHRLPVRVMHWINVVSLTLLLMSGLNIFNAHPALYWGKDSHFVAPWLWIRAEETPTGMVGVTTVGGRRWQTTGVLGVSQVDGATQVRGFPSWATVPGPQWLARARHWHFFFAWVFVLNGIAYLLYSIASRHLTRDLLPTRDELRGIGQSIKDHLRFKHPTGDKARRYNVLQILAYLTVIFVLLPLVVVAGLAMSPRLDAVFPGWVDLLGGRQSARSLHFIAAAGLLLFTAVHLFEVIVAGVWNELRSMITGWYTFAGRQADEGTEMKPKPNPTIRLLRRNQRQRRHLLRGTVAAAGAALLAGCDRLSRNEAFVEALKSVEHLNSAAHKLVAPRPAMAQEFERKDILQVFRSNGTLDPSDDDYRRHAASGFADYTLAVGGLVEQPAAYSLEQLRALPSRSQITRHDCVEGWSCIGQWKGVPLAALLARAKPLPTARFVVFRCFDSMSPPKPGTDSRYYESIDFDDAWHPQTILAYELNDQPLPISNGAPLRLRVERQLGYKHAKYLRAIELVDSLAGIRGGKGGYWEDEGYEWYAGI